MHIAPAELLLVPPLSSPTHKLMGGYASNVAGLRCEQAPEHCSAMTVDAAMAAVLRFYKGDGDGTWVGVYKGGEQCGVVIRCCDEQYDDEQCELQFIYVCKDTQIYASIFTKNTLHLHGTPMTTTTTTTPTTTA